MERRHRLLRSEEHTSELQSPCNLVCRLLLEKKNNHCECREASKAGLSTATRSHTLVRCSQLHLEHIRMRGEPVDFGRARPLVFFFFNDPAPTEISPLSLPDALPISIPARKRQRHPRPAGVEEKFSSF